MTTIDYNGKTLTLIQEAYNNCNPDHQYNCYTALAKDESGNQYKIEWDIVNIYAEEEEDVCDWDKFTVTEL